MQIPKSLFIIPDRNRTWAKAMQLPAMQGHTKGAENSRKIIHAAFEAGVEYVTFWAASELNLQKRESVEIRHLLKLLKEEINYRLKSSEEIRFRLIGNWQKYCQDPELQTLAEQLQNKTAEFTKKHLTILFGYSGRTELIEAFNKALDAKEKVTVQSIRQYFSTGFMPDLDLVIRTGVKDDLHWSDWALLLQMGNAVIYPCSKYWPDFSTKDLGDAFKYYGNHPRKLGA